jgi:hypothetical protein
MKTMVRIDRKRKYFLIAMALLLVAGFVYRVWPQIGNILANESDVAIKRKQLVKYQKMFQSAGDLEQETSLLRVTLKKGETGLLTGKTPALAAADIQKVLHQIAHKSHVEIVSVQVLKAKEMSGSLYLSIPVGVTIKGNIRQWKGFLYQIMASPKYLTVEKARITVHRRRVRGKTKNSQLISGKITINGFLKNSDEPSK